jgi:hypothetical protein
MPPKPLGKPKGLKASKRAAPFDPSAAAASTGPATGSKRSEVGNGYRISRTREASSNRSATVRASSSSTGPALNKEGTMPLDEDALTVADLFELASRVLEALGLAERFRRHRGRS